MQREVNIERWGLWQRNVQDHFKDMPTEDIKNCLKSTSFPYAVLFENWLGDFKNDFKIILRIISTFYGDKTRKSIRNSFNIRWANPIFRYKMIKRLTSTFGSSKLEKHAAKLASKFGFISSVAVDRYIADLLNNDKKIIIVEINGDLWHCNPSIWKSEDIHPIKKVPVQQIWDRDKKKKRLSRVFRIQSFCFMGKRYFKR